MYDTTVHLDCRKLLQKNLAEKPPSDENQKHSTFDENKTLRRKRKMA